MSLQKKGAGLIQSILLCKDLKIYVKFYQAAFFDRCSILQEVNTWQFINLLLKEIDKAKCKD